MIVPSLSGPGRVHPLRRTETSPGIEHHDIADQQGRSGRHLADAELVLLERRWLNGSGGILDALRVGLRRLGDGAAEPLFEPDRTESRGLSGHECALAEFGAEVERVWVGDDFARIVAGAQASSDERVEMERFGPADFNGAIERRAHGDARDRTGDILGGDRLDERRRDANDIAVSGSVSNGRDELEELCGLNDRVRDRRLLDQLLLRELGAEVGVRRETPASYDRQRHMMSDACGGSVGEQVVR